MKLRVKSEKFRVNSGQSLFEVVMAIAISALIIVAIVSLTSNSIQNSSYSKDKTLAATYVQEANEWLRGQRDSDINVFVGHVVTPIWCLKDLNWTLPGACVESNITGTPFSRQATFTVTTDVNGKNFIEADVTVSWSDAKGIHEVTSATDFSDYRQR
jgi:Tfp pilus assembly protein PilV